MHIYSSAYIAENLFNREKIKIINIKLHLLKFNVINKIRK